MPNPIIVGLLSICFYVYFIWRVIGWKQALCWLLGHKWDEWWRETSMGSYGHWCHRCRLWEFRQIVPSKNVIPFMAGYALLPEDCDYMRGKLYRLNPDGSASLIEEVTE